MSDTKISEAGIEASAEVLHCEESASSMDQARDLATLVIQAAIPHLRPQPAELAEQQGFAPEIEQLEKLVSSILRTVSLGYQTGPHAYAGEDFGRYLREATSDCRTILRMLPTLAATGKQQVGEVEWVRDIHDVEQGLIQRPAAPHAANNAPSPTVRMQLGEVMPFDQFKQQHLDSLVSEVQGSND